MTTESYESERLKKLISYKRKQFEKFDPDPANEAQQKAKKILQEEITFLQNSILPLIDRTTSLELSEVASYAIRCFKCARDFVHADGVIFYVPITEQQRYERPLVAIANPRQGRNYGDDGAISIYPTQVEIVNMDGVEDNQIEPLVIGVDDFIDLPTKAKT
jgi:hypothetical protein